MKPQYQTRYELLHESYQKWLTGFTRHAVPDAAGVLQVRLPERLRLWSVSGGSTCSAPGKCGGQSH